jgi:5-methylcytosine-specific restriction endonuclease McrA
MLSIKSLNASVLVLNASYEYLNVTTLRRAIKLLYKRKAEIVEAVSGESLLSISASHAMPSVIRMIYYIRRPFKEVPLTRKNILERDGHVCQYCGKPGATVDHIMPRSRGGEDSWTNCVCACGFCNRKKNNQTPKEAGMVLRSHPRKPSPIPWLANRRASSRTDWGRYLYMDG